MRISNVHVQLALYGIPPELAARNVAAAIWDRKSGREAARRQLEARQLKAVQAIVASHPEQLRAAGVTP